MKPSERVEQILIRDTGSDRGKPNQWIQAILDYLDEQAEKENLNAKS